jgi:hypothetical protein
MKLPGSEITMPENYRERRRLEWHRVPVYGRSGYLNEIYTWLGNNASSVWSYRSNISNGISNGSNFYFESEFDALAFALRWT